VLVTGASGLVGGRLAELLAAHHEVVATRHHAPVPVGLPAVDLDFLSPDSLSAALEGTHPDVVVHGAALADADRCEAEPDLAHRLNVEASAELARLSHARGARLIAISTDLVLPGDRPWVREDDPVHPRLVYGRTKLEGEEVVLREAPEAAVVRIALVLGRGFGPRATASEAVAWALAAGRRLRLFTDQFRTPVDVDSIADAVLRLIDRPLAGRFHLGGAERLSRHALGLRIARVLGLPEDGIEAITQAAAPLGVPRPAEASLDTRRARAELGWEPRALDDAIRDSRRAAL
jgi:dTDP-4-dehydrorhamnose reductase